MSLALLIRDWTASLREDFRNSLSIPINDCEAQITRVLESHATNYSTRISSIDGSYRIEASFVPISTTAIRSRIIRSPFNPIQPHLSHRIHRFLDRLDGWFRLSFRRNTGIILIWRGGGAVRSREIWRQRPVRVSSCWWMRDWWVRLRILIRPLLPPRLELVNRKRGHNISRDLPRWIEIRGINGSRRLSRIVARTRGRLFRQIWPVVSLSFS